MASRGTALCFSSSSSTVTSSRSRRLRGCRPEPPRFVVVSCDTRTADVYSSLAAKLLGPPTTFNAAKLKVEFAGEQSKKQDFPRAYTLTHCDFTANLTLAVTGSITSEQLRSWQSTLQRDDVVAEMLSAPFADKIRQRIVDNTTFPPGYYFPKWSQLRDDGTSHLCVVDSDRNAVATTTTTTVNSYFGARVLSSSTGIVLNNEMDDFSVPAERTPDHLPPAPANFVAPGKRPLSSMTPLIILKNGQLAGVVGGTNIIAAVTQVFLNHFIIGMTPLAAVQHPRIYHKLVPNVVTYENCTVIDGEVIALSGEAVEFLERRGHRVQSTDSGAVSQFIVQELMDPVASVGGDGVFRGKLTAVSDPRKDGSPAGL